MKFLIIKDTNGTKAYVNTKQIAVIQADLVEESEEDRTAILIVGTVAPIYVKGNVKTVVDTVRLIDHGVTNIDRDYDFEAVKKEEVDPINEFIKYFK